MSKKQPKAEEKPERPSCNKCGAPAEHELMLTVKRLKLTRGEGVGARYAWRTGYDASTCITTLCCNECLSDSLTVDVNVKANMNHIPEENS